MGTTATASGPPQPRQAGLRPPGAAEILRAPFSGRTWGELLYVLSSFPISLAAFVFTITTGSVGIGLLITFVGLPILAAGLSCCRALGRMERARARLLLGHDVAEPEPVRALQRGTGVLAWTGALFRSGVSWRSALYSLLHFPWAVFQFVLATVLWVDALGLLLYPAWQWVFPEYLDQPGIQLGGDGHTGFFVDSPPEIAVASAVGLVLLLVSPWVLRGTTQVDRLMVTGLLGPSKLATRVWELESDRGVVVDTAAADLRRIERDLHDGAQARL
ncbi:sensor domain-containing protein, partial [Streptomyces sp. NPDC054784]